MADARMALASFFSICFEDAGVLHGAGRISPATPSTIILRLKKKRIGHHKYMHISSLDGIYSSASPPSRAQTIFYIDVYIYMYLRMHVMSW